MAEQEKTETLAPAVSEENDSESDANDFDDLLKLVGGFGRYNILLYSFMCLMSVPIGFQQLVQVFYGASPSFTCVQSTEISSLNESCGVSMCCDNCSSYSYGTLFTSAVSQVSSCIFPSGLRQKKTNANDIKLKVHFNIKKLRIYNSSAELAFHTSWTVY